MGIQGLLKTLKSVTVQRKVCEYRGLTVAIDSYIWLHRIIKGRHAEEIYSNQISDGFVNDCLVYLNQFEKMGIKVLMVFDGARLPSKHDEEESRERDRKRFRLEAEELAAQGKREEAVTKMKDAFDVTPQIAYMLIAGLRKKGIPFIVAPYEADAQLAYLSRNNIVDVVITDDSDLLVFGARVVMFKLNFVNFEGTEIRLDHLRKVSTDPSLLTFNHCMFVSACILNGCDYIKNIRSVGIKKAFSVIRKYKNAGDAIQQFRDQERAVPENYEESFVRAFLTFRFQKVFCPIRQQCVGVNNVDVWQYVQNEWKNKNTPKKNLEWHEQILDEFMVDVLYKNRDMDLTFLGAHLPNDTIMAIAQGDLNPHTFRPYLELKFCQLSNPRQYNQIPAKLPDKKKYVPYVKNEQHQPIGRLTKPQQQQLGNETDNTLFAGTDRQCRGLRAGKLDMGESRRFEMQNLLDDYFLDPKSARKIFNIAHEVDNPQETILFKEIEPDASIVKVERKKFQKQRIGDYRPATTEKSNQDNARSDTPHKLPTGVKSFVHETNKNNSSRLVLPVYQIDFSLISRRN